MLSVSMSSASSVSSVSISSVSISSVSMSSVWPDWDGHQNQVYGLIAPVGWLHVLVWPCYCANV